jgi:hypothetical protein
MPAYEGKETKEEEREEEKHRFEPGGMHGDCKKCGCRITHSNHERPLTHREKAEAADNGEA